MQELPMQNLATAVFISVPIILGISLLSALPLGY
jgi:hypothetical protein